jgi:hypothetical protein
LRVRFGEHEVAVPVVAEWPDRLDGDDGRADRSGIAPRLTFADMVAGSAIRLLCAARPADSVGFFVVSGSPIPAAVVEPESLQILNHGILPADGAGSATFEVPVVAGTVAGGASYFVRVVFVTKDGGFVAASNSVVITTR